VLIKWSDREQDPTKFRHPLVQIEIFPIVALRAVATSPLKCWTTKHYRAVGEGSSKPGATEHSQVGLSHDATKPIDPLPERAYENSIGIL
jgi:hypothetical protein